MFGEIKINKCAWNWHIKTNFVLNSSSVFLLSFKIKIILTKLISYLNPCDFSKPAINFTFNSLNSPS